MRSRANRSVAIKQKLQDLFHSAKLLHHHLPHQVASNPNCLACLGPCTVSHADTSPAERSRLESRTEHDSPYVACKSQCRQSGWQAAGSYSMCPYICSLLAKMPSPSSSSSPAALPTGSLQTKNGSAKIYYKNSHSSGNQTAYYVKSAQHSDLSVCACVCVGVGVHTYMFAVCAGKTWQQIVRSNGKVSSALNCTFI